MICLRETDCQASTYYYNLLSMITVIRICLWYYNVYVHVLFIIIIIVQLLGEAGNLCNKYSLY